MSALLCIMYEMGSVLKTINKTIFIATFVVFKNELSLACHGSKPMFTMVGCLVTLLLSFCCWVFVCTQCISTFHRFGQKMYVKMKY